MHEYDITLKVLLQASSSSILRQVTGVSVARWLNIEMPQVQSSRVDLLGATAEDNLVHLELQSSNDPTMALRMAEYTLQIYRQFKRFPKQIVLYVGEPSVRMAKFLRSSGEDDPDFAFKYTLMDIRELDGAMLLKSPHIEDNLLAILTRLQDKVDMIREILKRIADLEDASRRAVFEQFLIISGLRRLEPTIKEEAQKMPILNDIMDHQVIGPAIRQGREEGLKEGLKEGRQEGRQEGREEKGREILRRQLEKRFGSLPKWASSRLANLSEPEVDELTILFVDAPRLEDLFPG
jgi:predicted transposase/invertase (TIGR01784 family)